MSYIVWPCHRLRCKRHSCQPEMECKRHSSCLSCTWITSDVLQFSESEWIYGFLSVNDKGWKHIVAKQNFHSVMIHIHKCPSLTWYKPDEKASFSNCPVAQHSALDTSKHIFFSPINWADNQQLLLTIVFVCCQSPQAFTWWGLFLLIPPDHNLITCICQLIISWWP